ncbi:uncharacterized protein ASPGLDRAFT_48039 [Aspergillus glaucus CBS 516.65]|uniref:EthD domain-containing protein n=1 Tax=Aspergillus glaucus CBS 516.65 TaxID=1160497 RepID=A0A1L9VHU0_ASPGL|nr:hypothetical protein ASPGLDRAFT_48039 [Aspergillus glaucus CBS 516.65]OJJ83489.1 hypothetical protein ASPGLDRAFT_48039 [Aspergillus glaucus CBS 516.65]
MPDYIKYKLLIRYGNYAAYETYDKDIQEILGTKYGELGATDIQPSYVGPSLPLLSISSFEAPDDVPLDELKDVILGENITTDIQPMGEYRQYRYS